MKKADFSVAVFAAKIVILFGWVEIIAAIYMLVLAGEALIEANFFVFIPFLVLFIPGIFTIGIGSLLEAVVVIAQTNERMVELMEPAE